MILSSVRHSGAVGASALGAAAAGWEPRAGRPLAWEQGLRNSTAGRNIIIMSHVSASINALQCRRPVGVSDISPKYRWLQRNGKRL